jgi:hypothetical protein
MRYRRVDDLPYQPGEFAIRSTQWGSGVVGPRLVFACPRRPGKLCGVPLQPSPPNVKGCSWQWDGNADAPTILPSIDCRVADGCCGWHGWVRAGEFTEC